MTISWLVRNAHGGDRRDDMATRPDRCLTD
jgi:hypothetical protein